MQHQTPPRTESAPLVILMADDDEDDRILTKEALDESLVLNIIKFVHDGEELIHYLTGVGEFNNRDIYPLPGLILLDLNMPKKDGREALAEIKSHPQLKTIPIVILTTSSTEEDMLKGYALGAASYLTKPVTFDGLVEMMQVLGKYWFEIVELPRSRKAAEYST